MFLFKDKTGTKCVGVRPEIPFKTTPIIKINLDDKDIIGFFAFTAALPLKNVPPQYIEKIDPKDPST